MCFEGNANRHKTPLIRHSLRCATFSTKEELDQLHIAAEHACESIALMVNGKIDEAMNRFNA